VPTGGLPLERGAGRALYRRLIAAGKPHKVALVACTRKVVERGTPWTSPARPRQVDALRRQPDQLAGAERAL